MVCGVRGVGVVVASRLQAQSTAEVPRVPWLLAVACHTSARWDRTPVELTTEERSSGRRGTERLLAASPEACPAAKGHLCVCGLLILA